MHTIKSAAKRLGVHPNTVRNRLNPSSKYHDPTFPKPVSLGDLPNSAQRISEDQLERWLNIRKGAAQPR